LEALNIHVTTLSLESDVGTLPLTQIIKKEEYLCRLIGVLTKFTKDQSDWSPGLEVESLDDEFSIVLNDEIPVEVKGIVYEIQVNILLGMTHQGQYATARKICQRVLEMYNESHCPLRRIRVIERFLYIAIVEGDHDNILELGSDAITTLASTKVYFNPLY
jgi:hypothetical protein